jgi:uncharacterized protein (TIGR03083 family)
VSLPELLQSSDERFAAFADGLAAAQWAHPSLCDRWTNHDVLAHLVIGLSAPARTVAAEMIRHRGSFDRANAALACSLAASRTAGELLDDFRQLARRPGGLGRYFPRRLLLGDHVTHELDIVFALDAEPTIPIPALVAVLNTQVALPNPFVPAFANSRGLRLRASDADWAHGDRGPLVEGRAADLVSVLGNRPKQLPRLSGDGVVVLASRVSRPSRMAGSGSPDSGRRDP